VLALALVARFVPGQRTVDDAFITYRYSRNLLAGRGFVYNPEERVQGTTTPLYTLLMAAERTLLPHTDYPVLAIFTNALADAASIALLALVCKRALGAPWLGIACGLIWALHPLSVTFAIGGMETSVYTFLLLLSLVSYATGHSLWSAFCCGVATLARPDALLVAAPLFAHMLLAPSLRHPRRLRVPWREGLIYLLVLAPWLVFATLYFGSPVTHSVVAKTAAYQLGRFEALIHVVRRYATPFFGYAALGPTWVAIGMVLYPFLALAGSIAMVRRRAKLLPFTVYPWLCFAAFAVANPLMFRWYLNPALLVYVVCIAYGARQVGLDLIAALRSRWTPPPATRRIVGLTAVVVTCALLLNAWTLHPDHSPDRPAPVMASHELEQLYRQAILDLRANEPVVPETRIAAGDIGVVGYVSEAHILDTLGLVSPESVPYYPLPEDAHVISYAVSTDLILREQPDYIVLLEVYIRNTLLQSSAFSEQYELYRHWPTDIYGSNGMVVYRRRLPRTASLGKH
jgi:hypothetical protein